MTRYQLLRLIRRLLGLHLPGFRYDWMPRTDDGYKELVVFVNSGDVLYRVEITIERLQ